MNERIKALLLNARNMFDNGVTDSNNKIYIHGSEENLAKFVELIVRECSRVYWNIDDGEIHSEYVKALKEHFGIEK